MLGHIEHVGRIENVEHKKKNYVSFVFEIVYVFDVHYAFVVFNVFYSFFVFYILYASHVFDVS